MTIRAERPPASPPSHRAEIGRPEREETCPRVSSAAVHSMDCSPSQYLVLMAMTWTSVAQQGFRVLRGLLLEEIYGLHGTTARMKGLGSHRVQVQSKKAISP